MKIIMLFKKLKWIRCIVINLIWHYNFMLSKIYVSIFCWKNNFSFVIFFSSSNENFASYHDLLGA